MGRFKTLRRIHFLPLILATTMVLACVIAYAIAVGLGHVYPFVPYISNTGTHPPQSCIFGQLLNFAALFGALCVYFEYRFLNCHLEPTQVCDRRLNFVSLIFGVTASVAVSFVGNFQVSLTFMPHMIAAGTLFLCGLIYSILNSIQSFRLRSQLRMSWLYVIRLALVPLEIISLALCVIYGGVAMRIGNPSSVDGWKPHEKGFTEHLTSTVTEWILMVFLLVYFLTLVPDLNKIYMEPVLIRLKSEEPTTTELSRGMIGQTNINCVEEDGNATERV